MRAASTYLGNVVAVTGGMVNIYLSQTVSSSLAIINGTTYRIGQVGSFIRIPQGYKDLYGIVCEVGAEPSTEKLTDTPYESGRWIKAQLVGEAVGSSFERGISQYPNVSDPVHLITEDDLKRIYGTIIDGHVEIGRLSSAENIQAKINIDRLVTRHSAILGSTGSGKSTTVSSLLRSISGSHQGAANYPSARILLLDIHGEYSLALSDVSKVFKIEPEKNEYRFSIPYWALDAEEIVSFLFGGVSDPQLVHIFDKITELKLKSLSLNKYEGINKDSVTVDTPIPFSLKQLWLELIDPELKTFEDQNKTIPALDSAGDAESLTEPKYKPHSTQNKPPFQNPNPIGLKRHLRNLLSRLLDRQYDFLLHPDKWEPNLDGKIEKDLPELLQHWLGHEKPISILDLSGIPSSVLVRLIGSILKIIYSALFWSRGKSESGIDRPLLIVMEEAHRYLHGEKNSASTMVQQIVKEGRKYGIGAMVVSQRPSEIDETILSQCGTFFALRLSNQTDRAKVKGTLPDSLSSLMDLLPVLRTGEAAMLPIRCRIILPDKKPNSIDPIVSEQWGKNRLDEKYRNEAYQQIAIAWRSQMPRRPRKPDFKFETNSIAIDEAPIMEKQQVISSNLAFVKYDQATQILEVEFKNGSIYQYYDVGPNIFEQLINATSKGNYFNLHIKNQFPYSRIS